MYLDDESDEPKKMSNKIHVTDIDFTVLYTRWLLVILGVWPLVTRNPSKTEKLIAKFLIIFCPIALAFTIVPTTIHMIAREKDPMVRLMLLGPVGFCLTNFVKLGFIVYRHKMIKLCIEHVEIDWMKIENENDRMIMRRNVKVAHSLTIMCGGFMYSGGMSYHTIMPLWLGSTINEFNETIRPLVYPGFDIFVNPQSSPTYEIIFFSTCVSAFVTYTVTTAACNIAAIFVAHACGQIQIVISRLESLVEGIDENQNSPMLQGRISFIIQLHVRILRFTSTIEQVLREICLVEVVTSTLTICLLEYYCMTEWNNSETIAIITDVVLLISLSFNIFIFCHIGELLQEQCYQVAKASYMVEWYRLPGKTGLALIMIIAMANSPRKITAGQMMDLSVRSFGGIMKTSVAYLNMLRTVAE